MALSKKGRGMGRAVAEMCGELGASPSGYRSYAAREARGPSPRKAADLRDFSLVKAAFEHGGYPKGARLIALMMPRLLGVAMNRKKVSRLMRKFGLACPVRKASPLRRIARAIQTSSAFSNKLNRQLAVCSPGLHLLTYVPCVRYGGGRLCFLSAVKDASTNEIVA